MVAHAHPRRPGTGARTHHKPAGRPRGAKPARDTRPTAAVRDDAGAGSQPLTPTQRRYLRGLCHDLRPLVLLGNKGVTPQVELELGQTLAHHELVKVRLSGGDRAQRQQQIDALLAATGAELVQQIGHVASLFRRNPDQPRLALPA